MELIKKYDYQEYLSLFGVVFQDFHIFGVSVAENIAMDSTWDKKKVKELLKQVELLEYVDSLPDKENTVVRTVDKDAIDISGGQAQKLSIARSMYKDAPFVILDEPTDINFHDKIKLTIE